MDLEDSVAAVDGEDKAQVYRNWLGLMRGDLTDTFQKRGQTQTRRLAEDRAYTAPDGTALTLPGRSLMFVRNVGHLMTTPAVRIDGQDAYEGQVDTVITSLIALHDRATHRNSRTGSVYIVKPKMHGPHEAAFANDLFDATEDLLQLPRHTIKIGLMDEERRTSAQPRRVRPRRCATASSSSIPAFSTGPETRSTPPCAPVRLSARKPCAPRRGSRRMRTTTSMSAWRPGSRAKRRSARACGPRPTAWRT